ncbi:MAG: type II secretion system protein J [Phycisphaerae bacterium]
MKQDTPHTRHPAFTLVELMIAFMLFAVIGSIAFWGIRLQMDTQRRIALQANRHAVMRSVLRHLREDLARTTRIEWEPGPTSMPADYPAPAKRAIHLARGDPSQSLRIPIDVAALRLHTTRGTVRYHIHEVVPLYRRPNNTTRRSAPPTQTLVRAAADGSTRRWSMYDMQLSLTAGKQAPAQLLRVRFGSLTQYGTGHRRMRRYETALAAGGAS